MHSHKFNKPLYHKNEVFTHASAMNRKTNHLDVFLRKYSVNQKAIILNDMLNLRI